MKAKVISTFMIVLGIVFFIGSIGMKRYTKIKETSLINEFENELKYTRNLDYKNDDLNVEKKLVNLNEEGEKIAIIEIPSIEMKSVIVQGTSNNSLRYYIGHFMNTRMPGEQGNFCIAGHSSNMYNEIFNNIHLVEKGDLIKIITLESEYMYYVNDMYTVSPKDTDILEDDEDKKILTIVTCTDDGDERLIIRAEMVS